MTRHAPQTKRAAEPGLRFFAVARAVRMPRRAPPLRRYRLQSGRLAPPGAARDKGPGTLVLSVANSYSGGTTVSGGTLQLSGSGTLGATTGTLGVSGGTLDLGGTSQTTGALTLTDGTIQNGTLTSSSFGVQAGTISAVLAGAGALSKTGIGTVMLSGINTYTGATTVNGGTLEVDGAIANTSADRVNNRRHAHWHRHGRPQHQIIPAAPWRPATRRARPPR